MIVDCCTKEAQPTWPLDCAFKSFGVLSIVAIVVERITEISLISA